jgi:hypothetical protein
VGLNFWCAETERRRADEQTTLILARKDKNRDDTNRANRPATARKNNQVSPSSDSPRGA